MSSSSSSYVPESYREGEPGIPISNHIENNLLISLNENIKVLTEKISELTMRINVMERLSQGSSSSSVPDKRINIADLVSIKRSVIDYATVNNSTLTIYKTDRTTMEIILQNGFLARDTLRDLNNELLSK